MWIQKIRETSSSKQKLCLIYLANGMDTLTCYTHLFANSFTEIVQQSKIRKKEDFVRAYIPVIAEATSLAYKGSSSEVQQKIRRVVEVWRQRVVFPPQTQAQIEAAIDEVDRSRSGRKPALGGSLFSSSSIPPELATVAPLATALQKADMNAKPAVTAANQDYDKLTTTPIPSPPMYAASLAALVKKLATAEGAVAESIKARRALISGLEKLLETNKAKLSSEEGVIASLNARKLAIDGRKSEVEDGILKGLPVEDQQAISAAPLPVAGGASQRPARPDIEELTPPPMESFTPVGSPQLAPQHVPDDVFGEPVANPVEPVSVPAPPGTTANSTAPVTAIGSDPNAAPNVDISAQVTQAAPAGEGMNGAQAYHERSAKKRKMSRSIAEDELAAFQGDGEIQGLDETLGSLI
jgi:regulator of Ty1 transposition protein 103